MILDLLRRLFRRPPPPTARSSRASVTPTTTPELRLDYPGAEAPRRSSQVSWRRERLKGPRYRLEDWARRVTPRQRILVVAALISVGAMAVRYINNASVVRGLPVEVRGLWYAEEGPHAGRYLELQSRRIAFSTADSGKASTLHWIQRVHVEDVGDGTRYEVDYDVEGNTATLSFVFSGSPPAITFDHQPTQWRLLGTSRTMMPGI